MQKNDKGRPSIVSRRDVVISAAQFSALVAMLAGGGAALGPALAQDKAPDLPALFKAVLGDAKPIEGKVVLDLPEIAENGSTVPFGVLIESPMTGADFVKAIHIVAPENPQPQVASFFFTSRSGKAQMTSRMRLSKTQDVYALAELSDGKAYLAKRTVKVTIGGCGG